MKKYIFYFKKLLVFDWSFQNNEDQLFATNQLCVYLSEVISNETVNRFDLKFIAHTPQNKSSAINSQTQNRLVLSKLLKLLRESFNIEFNFMPETTCEDLLSSHNEKEFLVKRITIN